MQEQKRVEQCRNRHVLQSRRKCSFVFSNTRWRYLPPLARASTRDVSWKRMKKYSQVSKSSWRVYRFFTTLTNMPYVFNTHVSERIVSADEKLSTFLWPFPVDGISFHNQKKFKWGATWSLESVKRQTSVSDGECEQTFGKLLALHQLKCVA